MVEQVRKHWDSGRLLGERFEDSPLFPLKLRTRNARSRDLSERFDRVREWVGMLREHDRQHKGFGYEIEWRRVNHRTRGGNDLPKRIVIPSREDALKMIGKTRAAATFDRLADDLLADFPQLDAWLARRPLVALARADDWPRLKTVLAWFRDHPRPGLYLRQLDIPGVDTKFIQTRRQLVGELLDQVLPPEAIDPEAVGVRLFEQRYGLKGRPPLIRFRVLDPALKIAGLSDLSVLPAEFARLEFAQLNPARRAGVRDRKRNQRSGLPAVPRFHRHLRPRLRAGSPGRYWLARTDARSGTGAISTPMVLQSSTGCAGICRTRDRF